MIPILANLTKLFWILSTWIFLPLALGSIAYGKISGQISFSEAPKLSPFEKGEKHPITAEKQPWLDEQLQYLTRNKKLPVLPTAEANPNSTTKVEKPTFKLPAVWQRVPRNTNEKKKHKDLLTTAKETVEKDERKKVEAKDKGGRPKKVEFKSMQKVFVGKLSKDYEGKTEEGIPFVLKEGTEIRVLAPGLPLEELLDEKKVKKLKEEELEKDENLGPMWKQKMDKADIYDMILVGGGLFLIIFAGKMVPPGALQNLLIIIGFGVVVLDTFIIELLFQLIIMSYPYLKVMLPSSGIVLHAYIDGKPETKPITKIMNKTHFKTRWPVKHPFYGSFNEFVIHHELDFWERAPRKRGKAIFQDYVVPHSDVHQVICHEYPGSGSDVWQDKRIPAFMLAYGYGGDVNLVPLPLTATLNAMEGLVESNPQILAGGKNSSFMTLLTGMRHYDAMVFELSESWRQVDAYRSDKMRLQRGEESGHSQTQGLLGLQTDVTKRAFEFILALHEVHKSIAQIIKSAKKPWALLINKYVATIVLGAICAITFGYVLSKPNLVQGIGLWMSKLQNQILMAIVLVSSVVILAVIGRRRGKE